MGVTVDQVGSLQGTNSTVISFNYSGVTVGAGGTNTALFAWLLHGAGGNPTSITATWDSGGTNQAMTAIGGATATGIRHRMYGLLNPTPGNKTLNVAWTTNDQIAVVAVSLRGVLQTSVAAAFINPVAQAYTASTNPTLSITASGPGTDIVLGCLTNANAPVDLTGFTQIFNTQLWLSSQFGCADYTVATGSPVVFNWSLPSSLTGSESGVEVVWDGTTGGGGAGLPVGIRGLATTEW
jgi:hypothetical protein